MSKDWNHNIYYHKIILHAVPKPCLSALDIGCGNGLLTRKLASYCDYVIGIDLNTKILSIAKEYPSAHENITYIEGDVMSYLFKNSSFNLIALVATLHHLPLHAALQRLQELLAPGGVLVVIGLYKTKGIGDFIRSAAALPVSWLTRCMYHYQKMDAPIKPPKETLTEIKKTAAELMPGAVIRRHFFYRYSLICRKPE